MVAVRQDAKAAVGGARLVNHNLHAHATLDAVALGARLLHGKGPLHLGDARVDVQLRRHGDQGRN